MSSNPPAPPAQPACPPTPPAPRQPPVGPTVLLKAPTLPPHLALLPCLLRPGLLPVAHSYYAAHPFYCRRYVHCCSCYIDYWSADISMCA